jgi:hypothetical protein
MNMLVAFTDGSPSFVNGFELGMIWQQMQAGESPIDRGVQAGFPIHTENIEVAIRMAQAAEVGQEDGGWTAMHFEKGMPKPVLTLVSSRDLRP